MLAEGEMGAIETFEEHHFIFEEQSVGDKEGTIEMAAGQANIGAICRAHMP